MNSYKLNPKESLSCSTHEFVFYLEGIGTTLNHFLPRDSDWALIPAKAAGSMNCGYGSKNWDQGTGSRGMQKADLGVGRTVLFSLLQPTVTSVDMPSAEAFLSTGTSVQGKATSSGTFVELQ